MLAIEQRRLLLNYIVRKFLSRLNLLIKSIKILKKLCDLNVIKNVILKIQHTDAYDTKINFDNNMFIYVYLYMFIIFKVNFYSKL